MKWCSMISRVGLDCLLRLLIEGRPGSGKTTLVHKFSQDWGRGGTKSLEGVKFLFQWK